MYYKKCDACGANLDFNEVCDCQKEKDYPHTTEISPNKDADINLHNNSITPKSQQINSHCLKSLRISKNIPSKELVAEVRKMYPKYDKPLQSKCERGEDYGIELRRDALEALFEKYAPEQLEAMKRRRSDTHRLKCRISCRLEDDDYNHLMVFMKDDGFTEVQAWLTNMVRNYIKAKLNEAKGHKNGRTL